MNKFTYSNLKLISTDVKPSGKKNPNKSALLSNKIQLENSSLSELIYIPHLSRLRSQYLARKQEAQVERALEKHHIKELLDNVGSGAKKFLSLMVLFGLKKIPHQTIGNIIDGRVRFTVIRWQEELLAAQEELGFSVIDIKKGKKHRVANLYRIRSFIYKHKDILFELLSMLDKTFLSAMIRECHSIIRNIILRMVNTYNKYINPPNKTVMSSPKSETIHFSRRESGKVRVSDCDNKLYAQQESVHTQGNPKRVVLNSKSMPGLPINAKLKENVVKLVADFENTSVADNKKKKTTMPMDSLRILADIENEQKNTQRRKMDSHGPLRMCPAQFQDLQRSISYHFSGSYTHQPGDRLFDKQTTSYLRKKYNL